MFLLSLILLTSELCLGQTLPETMLGIDPQFDLHQAKAEEIQVRTQRLGEKYVGDASAVLSGVDLADLIAVSLDYDSYARMGMPNLRESVVVDRTDRALFTWNHLQTGMITSQHYLQVRIHDRLPDDSFAVSWELYYPQRSDTEFRYPDQPAFDLFSGSWYMTRLPDGRIYVRYYLVADPALGVPDFVISRFVKHQFGTNTKQVIRALARAASLRQ